MYQNFWKTNLSETFWVHFVNVNIYIYIIDIDNIRISVLKIIQTTLEREICERDKVIKYGTVYPYSLNVMFNQINVIKNFKAKNVDDSKY